MVVSDAGGAQEKDETDCWVGTPQLGSFAVVITPPKAVRLIAERLEQAGFETWCVGGAVRDALLGHPHLDWDLATAATPSQVQKVFRRTVPVGIEFGTVGVLDDAGVMHEVTTFRRDVQTDGRHAVVEFGASLDDDLARRDLTINAIAVSPKTGEIRDPFGGQQDLTRRIVRAVGVADERMREDRLRALRAIRFASRLDFAIDPTTWEAITRSAPHLSRLSRERVKQEIEKTMEQVRCPSRAFGLWRSSGALASLVPELMRQDTVAFAAADHIPLRGAARRPDRVDARRIHRVLSLFLGLPAIAVRSALHDLRFSNADVRTMTKLAEHWTALFEHMTETLSHDASPDAALVCRWAATTGRTHLGPFLRVAEARWAAMRAAGEPAPSAERAASVYRRAIRIGYRDPIELADLQVDGEDLQREGIARGPALGKILRALLDWVVDDPSRNTRDALTLRAAQLAREIERASSDVEH
jgi:tRNA nucleotidyltransferase (CCA-adding enzyme)